MATTGINHKKMVTTSKQSVFDMRKIATILLYRRFLILGVSCAVMSATSLLAVVAKPMYQSSMEIMVKDNLEQELSFNKNIPSSKSEFNNFKISVQKPTSQMQLMVSSKLVQKAVNLLSSDYPKITVDDIKGNVDTGRQSFLNIRLSEEAYEPNLADSQVFIVSFKDPDPIKTQRVLQALQKVYQDYNIEQKNQQIQQGLAFVNHRLPNLQRQTLAAEKKLEIFRKKYNFIDPELQSKVLLASLTDIQKQRRNIRSQLEEIQNRYNSIELKLIAAKQDEQLANSLNRSSRYQALVNEIRSTEMSLEQESLRYTDDSPIIINLEEKRKIQMALLEQELKDPVINSKIKRVSEVSLSLANDLKQLDKQRASIVKNDNDLAKSEKAIHSQLNNYPSLITEYNRLLSEVKLQQKSFENLVELQNSLGIKIAQGGFDIEILEEPDLGIYIGTKKWLLIISGVIFGPIIGVILALVLEMFNRVIVSPVEIQKLTSIRVLGSVPKFKKSGLKNRLQNIWRSKWEKSGSPILEKNNKLSSHKNLDMIYQNLQIFKNSLPLKSLMLTSSLPGEGKTTLALGLAASAANMHQRVLVIDANLRSPSLHNILGLSNDWGLSLLLLDDIKTKFHNYIQPIHPSIDVLTAGSQPDDVVNLLSSGRLKELIESFEKIYDLVIIDTSSVLDSVDARIIASISDGIVIVGRIGQLSPQELMETTEILSQLNLIGIIANEVNDSSVKEQTIAEK